MSAARAGAVARAAAVALAALALSGGAAPAPAGAEAPRPGDPVPDFALADTSGRVHRLADYRGRTVVLEWTNPRCPVVQRVYRKGTTARTLAELRRIDPTVAWIAVNSTRGTTVAENAKWLRQHRPGYPVLLDLDGAVGRRYDARRTPHVFVVDRDGVLRYHGAIDDDRLGTLPAPETTSYVLNAVRRMARGEPVRPDHVKPYGCAVKYGE